MKYLDTVTESVERIKEGRNNINKGITFIFIIWILFFIITFLVFIVDIDYAIWLSTFVILYLILLISLVIKREIYSIAILLKEKEI